MQIVGIFSVFSRLLPIEAFIGMLRDNSSRRSRVTVPLDYLKECFEYNRDNGTFTWKQRPLEHFDNEGACKISNIKNAGNIAGHKSKTYIYIGVVWKGTCYRFAAQDLVWMFEGREFVEGKMIDHKDRNKTNNVITNLRLATNVENTRNGTKRKRNKSGHIGVWLDERYSDRKKWRACVKAEGKTLHLGGFPTIEEAIAARVEGERVHYGEFSSSNPISKSIEDYTPYYQLSDCFIATL